MGLLVEVRSLVKPTILCKLPAGIAAPEVTFTFSDVNEVTVFTLLNISEPPKVVPTSIVIFDIEPPTPAKGIQIL